MYSLQTKDSAEAAKLAHQAAMQQNALWENTLTANSPEGAAHYDAAQGKLAQFQLATGRWEYWIAGNCDKKFLDRLSRLCLYNCKCSLIRKHPALALKHPTLAFM